MWCMLESNLCFVLTRVLRTQHSQWDLAVDKCYGIDDDLTADGTNDHRMNREEEWNMMQPIVHTARHKSSRGQMRQWLTIPTWLWITAGPQHRHTHMHGNASIHQNFNCYNGVQFIFKVWHIDFSQISVMYHTPSGNPLICHLAFQIMVHRDR